MANTGKSEPTIAERNERMALVKSLAALSPDELRVTLLTPVEVGAMTIRSVKTLEKDRNQHKAAKDAGAELDPLLQSSIPSTKPAGSREVRYTAFDVLAYLNRLSASVDRSGLTSRQPGAAPTAMHGFQTWLGEATPLDTWPFSIRLDGRPVDMAEALATGQTTGHAERLTLREFGDRLADASSASFHADEAAALEGVSAIPQTADSRRAAG
ncbi:MAG: hypothetical protein V4508_08770 [Pseudomonadota bacterium]